MLLDWFTAVLPSERFLQFSRDRDFHALEELLRDHAVMAHAHAQRLLGNSADADDAVQEALLRLVRTADRFDGSVSFEAWLGRLVHDSAIDVRRSSARRSRREAVAGRELQEHSASHEVESDSAVADQVRRAVGDLPERYRAPLDLHYFAGLSQEQTAQALGLSTSAVVSRIHRGKNALRKRLQRLGVTVSLAIVSDALMAPVAPAAVDGAAIIGRLRDGLVAHAVAVPAISTGLLAAGVACAVGLGGSLWLMGWSGPAPVSPSPGAEANQSPAVAAKSRDQKIFVTRDAAVQSDFAWAMGSAVDVHFKIIAPPRHGAVWLPYGETTWQFRYRPEPGFDGADSFTWEVTDAAGDVRSPIATCSVDVIDPGQRATAHLNVAGGSGGGDFVPGTLALISAGEPPAGMRFDSWTSQAKLSCDWILSPKTLVLVPEDGLAVVATFRPIDAATPAITSALKNTAEVGKPFTYQISATSEPLSYIAVALPPGLYCNERTGVISGTPSIFGTAYVGLRANNAAGDGTVSTLVLEVHRASDATGGSL